MRLPSSLQDRLYQIPSRSKGGRCGSSWWYSEQRPALGCTSASLPLPCCRGSMNLPNQSQHNGSYHVLMPSMEESQWSISKLQLRICSHNFHTYQPFYKSLSCIASPPIINIIFAFLLFHCLSLVCLWFPWYT